MLIDTINNPSVDSEIDIESTGRVNKADVIYSLQQSGAASYDLARETLKSVSVDASGKVELEDYVEVSKPCGLCKSNTLFISPLI